MQLSSSVNSEQMYASLFSWLATSSVNITK